MLCFHNTLLPLPSAKMLLEQEQCVLVIHGFALFYFFPYFLSSSSLGEVWKEALGKPDLSQGKEDSLSLGKEPSSLLGGEPAAEQRRAQRGGRILS